MEAPLRPEFFAQALSKSEKLLAQASKLANENNPLDAEGLVERAQIFRNIGELDNARNALGLTIEPSDRTIQEYITLAEAFATPDDASSAIAVLEEGLKLAPEVAPDRDGYNTERGMSDIGFALAKYGAADQAFSAIEHSKKYPLNESPYRTNMMGSIIFNLARYGHIDDAVRGVTMLENEGSDSGYNYLARGCASRGDLATVDQYKEKGLLTIAGQTNVNYDLAEYFLKEGDVEIARAYVDKAVSLLPQIDAKYRDMFQRRLIDFALEKLADTEMAQSVAEQMDQDVNAVDVSLKIARLQYKQEQKTEANETLQSAEEKLASLPQKDAGKAYATTLAAEIGDLYMQFGRNEEGKARLDQVIKKYRRLSSYDKGNFFTSVHKRLSKAAFEYVLSAVPAERKLWASALAEDEIKEENLEKGASLLDEEVERLFSFENDTLGDEFVKKARESAFYSLDRLSRLFIQANRPDKARAVIERYFNAVYATRSDKNTYYYHNCLRVAFRSALESDNFDLAHKIIDEMSEPFVKSDAYTEFAKRLLENKSYEAAQQQLVAAEETADKNEYPADKSRSLLKISNTYLLLAKSGTIRT